MPSERVPAGRRLRWWFANGHTVKSRRVFQVAGVSGLIALIVFAWPRARYQYGVRDTLACLFTTGRHATRYAAGYTESAFAQIQVGMMQGQVLGLLGEPLERVTYPPPALEVDWKYSQAASRSGHCHLRLVRFTPDGRVAQVFKLFHFD